MDMGRLYDSLGRALALAVFLWVASTYLRPLRDTARDMNFHIMYGAIGAYCLVIALMVIIPRFSLERSAPMGHRLLACACMALPLSFALPLHLGLPGARIEVVTQAGYWVAASGAVAAIACVLSMGRSYGLVPSRRRIVTHGPYRLVRHPIFTSYAVMLLGYLMVSFSFWALGLALATIAGLYVRTALEERVLRDDDGQYQEYSRKVRFRFIPWLI